MKNGKTEQTEPEVDFGLRLFGPGALPSESSEPKNHFFGRKCPPKGGFEDPLGRQGVPKIVIFG